MKKVLWIEDRDQARVVDRRQENSSIAQIARELGLRREYVKWVVDEVWTEPEGRTRQPAKR